MPRELLWHYSEHWGRTKPGAEIIVCGERRMKWGEFSRAVDDAAKAFLELGVQRGDRVAMIAMACPEFLITFMAASKVGAIWLGISPKSSRRELEFLIGDSAPAVLMTVPSFSDRDLRKDVPEIAATVPGLRKVLSLGEPFDSVEPYESFVSRDRAHFDAALGERASEVKPDDDVLLMYTSGSTGKPKGVLQTHRSIIANIAAELRGFGLSDSTRSLLHFPINHVAACVEIGYATIMAGGAVVMMDKFDPLESLAIVEKERITLFGQVPTMFLMQMATPQFRTVDWRSVEAFAWGGSTPPLVVVETLAKIASQTGARLLTGYGSTETCGFITYTEQGLDNVFLAHTAGKVAPDFELRIVDDARKPLPPHAVGEVAVRGPMLFSHYFKNPAATAEVRDDQGWYYTNDLGSLDENGYLTLTGRKSEMYKTGGENVYPREVEEVIETHPGVLMAAVVGVPDSLYSEIGVAFVMQKPGAAVTESDLVSLCRDHLANFKVPKQFDVRPILPMLPNGKVDKLTLKKSYLESDKGV